MKFNVITPPSILRPYIKYIWTAEGTEGTYRQFFCADANTKIILSNGSTFTHHSHLNMHHSYKRVSITDFDDFLDHCTSNTSFAGIIGPSKEYSIIRFDGAVDMVGVQFTEIGGYFLQSCPPCDIRESFVSTDKVMGSELDAIRKNKDINTRVSSLVNFFASKLLITDREKEDIELLNTIFQRYNTSATIGDIAQDTCLCERQLRRLCNKYVGMSIQDVLALRRFHSAMLLLADRETSLPNTITNEYFDQSHMNKEFTRYCGHTPSAIRTHWDTSKWLHTSTPFAKLNPNNIIMMV